MNRNGETFEERPPAGEYWLCPLYQCKYKLLVAAAFDPGVPIGHAMLRTGTVRTWVDVTPSTLSDLVRDRMSRHVGECERLMREHLRSHKMADFYITRAWLHEEYLDKVAKIEKLTDLVFHATAVQESTEGGE